MANARIFGWWLVCVSCGILLSHGMAEPAPRRRPSPPPTAAEPEEEPPFELVNHAAEPPTMVLEVAPLLARRKARYEPDWTLV